MYVKKNKKIKVKIKKRVIGTLLCFLAGNFISRTIWLEPCKEGEGEGGGEGEGEFFMKNFITFFKEYTNLKFCE